MEFLYADPRSSIQLSFLLLGQRNRFPLLVLEVLLPEVLDSPVHVVQVTGLDVSGSMGLDCPFI